MESNLRDAFERTRIDFVPSKRPPSILRLATAIAIAVGLALGACVAIVHVGVVVFPSTRGFSHFRLSDYGTLTCIGVVVASVGWPLVIRVSSSPRWLYLRGAVVVTLVLWLPDVWLFAKGEPGRGVGVLAVMHLAVALITYNVIVRLAPAREIGGRLEEMNAPGAGELNAQQPKVLRERLRPLWIAMVILIVIEFALGVVTILFVPISRPTGWIPVRGKLIFALHGVVGIVTLLGALEVVLLSRPAGRVPRIASIGGVLGVALGGAGGLLAVDRGLRFAGLGMMFLASGVALFAYLIPLIEPESESTEDEDQVSADASDTGDKPALT